LESGMESCMESVSKEDDDRSLGLSIVAGMGGDECG